MAIETTLRTTTAGSAGGATSPRAGASARPLKAGAAEPGTERSSKDIARASAPAVLSLRGKATHAGGAQQDQVARAQQALDYLDRVAAQLEAVKGDLTSKLAGMRSGARQQLENQNSQLSARVRQLSQTLALRRKSAGGGVDANLNFNGKPASQRFRIRGLDLAALRQRAPQSLAFSVGANGGPQLSANIEADQTDAQLAAAIDRAMAPMGVRAGLDGQGALVFSTTEEKWPAVKDGIAISGLGRVATEEVAADLAPQQWNVGGGSGAAGSDELRQNLREVVQALERVRRSRDAASSALSAATIETAQVSIPAPEVEVAAQAFASTASNPDYESLLSLTSALVGVSRERVLALLGLR